MSNEVLTLIDEPVKHLFVMTDKGMVKIESYFGYDVPRAIATIDHNQAHLLMLWLQENFK